ncbi:MAG TPA: hypothetical protein DIW43_03180 [Spongiibacteraceae bacterium]|nr:hypothetical protein [Spongiibacteraceae bacterium]HCS26427.1 hypothetical protein [Spongiibacteraceae bacterium]|tara:strand:+ start:2417 stop:2707 length:291 start_codon:yes stop_codon:yes gene_type:complete
MTYSFQSQILSDQDLFALTHKQRPTAQARSLNALGIDHKFRPDGTLLVLSDCVRRALGLDASANDAGPKKINGKSRVKKEGLLSRSPQSEVAAHGA